MICQVSYLHASRSTGVLATGACKSAITVHRGDDSRHMFPLKTRRPEVQKATPSWFISVPSESGRRAAPARIFLWPLSREFSWSVIFSWISLWTAQLSGCYDEWSFLQSTLWSETTGGYRDVNKLKSDTFYVQNFLAEWWRTSFSGILITSHSRKNESNDSKICYLK